MATPFFDTLEYVNRLAASGVPSGHAKAHATALIDIMQNELVTKTDLRDFRAEVNAQFSGVDVKFAGIDVKFAGIETEFAQVRGELALLKWMTGFLLAGVVTILFKIFQ